uniref:Uncharacterized protein n=1 Tax=Rhizophora mucronata TaxID=61149 RepID=A0A2P2MGF6_RHIMU
MAVIFVQLFSSLKSLTFFDFLSFSSIETTFMRTSFFNIGLKIGFIAVRVKINFLRRLVDHTFHVQQTHVLGLDVGPNKQRISLASKIKK